MQLVGHLYIIGRYSLLLSQEPAGHLLGRRIPLLVFILHHKPKDVWVSNARCDNSHPTSLLSLKKKKLLERNSCSKVSETRNNNWETERKYANSCNISSFPHTFKSREGEVLRLQISLFSA